MRPDIYLRNNVMGTINLVEAMLKSGFRNLVLSSTSAILGIPEVERINEKHLRKPTNPYGRSKLMVEQMLESICKAYESDACRLRYFNAAGADQSGDTGEAHDPKSHLIPNVLGSLLQGGNNLKVFGDDYDTHDGTCVRDHVCAIGLAQAHPLGLDFLERKSWFRAFNLGNGAGYSVLGIAKVSSEIAECEVGYGIAPRRKGDSPKLGVDCSNAIDKLGRELESGSLFEFISSAWRWHKRGVVALRPLSLIIITAAGVSR